MTSGVCDTKFRRRRAAFCPRQKPAQAHVDDGRTSAVFADVIALDAFDEAKVKDAANERVNSADRLRDAVVRALGKIHAILEPAQRAKLAYLIRTGTLSI